MGKGYNNYMCKKPFHPGSKANIKRAWMAEQQTENDKKKQDELKVQYEKEQDLYKNKALISSESKDKLELNFMYEAPPGAKRERQKEDDEPEYKFEWQRKYNAPREDYAKGNADIKDQPFGIPVRNVRCIKCHKWGHINTDKECPLFSQASTSSMPTTSMDPMELMRQMREDGFGLKENVLGHHLNPKAANQQLIPSDDESDPEAEFLKSLSTADKKKLLRKLKKLSKKQEKKAKSKKKKSKKTKKKSAKKDSSDSDSDEKPKRKKKRKESSSSSSKSSSSDSDSEHETTKEKTVKTQFIDDQRYVSSRDDRNSKLYPTNLEPNRKHHSKESNEWEAEDKSHPKDRNKSYRHAKDQRYERNYSYDQPDVKPGSKRSRDPDDKSSKKSKTNQQHSSSSSDLENEHVNAKQKHDKTKYDQKCKSYKDDKVRNAKFDSEEDDRNHHSKESYKYEPSRKHEQTERSYKLSKDSRNEENAPDVHPQIKSESRRSKDAVSDEVDEKSKSHHQSKNNSINKRQSPDTYKATKTYKPDNTGIIIRSVQEICKKIKKDSTDEKTLKNKEAPTHPDGFSHTCPQAVIPANYESNTKEYAGVQHDKFRDFYRDDRSPSVKQKYNK